MKDSTKKLSKELGLKNAEQTAHLYLYINYIDHYLSKMGGPLGLVTKSPSREIPPDVEEVIELYALKVMRESLSAETSSYHAKVVPLRHAEDLVMVQEDIEIRGLERVIPYKIAHDIVLKNPQNIAVFNCPCRMLQENPCEPLEVCLAVGDPVASFILENEQFQARKIPADEAVEILRAERKRGHVHNAFFKDVVGGRFFAICNCCPCCCVGMKAWLKLGTPIVASSGYVAKVYDECTACGDCAEICPFDAIEVAEVAVVDEVKCMGCGVCEGACADEMIQLVADPTRSQPLDIKRLIAEHGVRQRA
jgi:ferredoxin